MFDRFTGKAKHSLNLARNAARRFDHPYIGPEHMLHGVLSVGESRGLQILASHAVSAASLLATLERHIIPSKWKLSESNQLPFTPEGKRALEKSMEAAQASHQNWLGTEHLLHGLSECGSGIVAEVFREHSLTSAMLFQGLLDPTAKPEDGPQDSEGRAQGRKTAKQQEQALEQALRVALELNDEPAARAIWGLIKKLQT